MRNTNGFSRGLNWDDQESTYPNRVDAGIIADAGDDDEFLEVLELDPPIETLAEFRAAGLIASPETLHDKLFRVRMDKLDRIETLRRQANEAAKIVRAIETLRNAGLLD